MVSNMSTDSSNDTTLLDHIFNDAQTLYALLDTDFNFVRVNKAYASIDSKEPEYFVGKNHFSLYPNEDNENVFRECIKTGRSHKESAKGFDYEYNPERGTTYWDWTLQPIKNSDGKVTNILLSLIDVSERIHAEQLLNKAQEIAHIGTWNWDIKKNRLEWTDEIYRIFDKKPEAFSATYEHFLEFVHPDDRELVNDAVKQCFVDPDKKYEIEHRILLPDGNIKYVEEHGVVYHDIDNIPSRMIGIVHDITERKNHELALKKHQENLEELVADKTKELIDAQDELLRNEKLATLGKLTATIGHEIRNPLAAIKPMLFLLNNTTSEKNPKTEHYLEVIERNISRCDQIIDELLTYSRTSKLTKQKFNLHQWLNGMVEEIDFPEDLDIDICFEAPNDCLTADLNRLGRAVNNIIDNAVAAMYINENSTQIKPQSKLQFHTTITDDMLHLTIKDNGKGIPEEILPKIMEPLFSTKNFGVGLGMGIIDQIATDHNGRLEISSESDKGTSVSLLLPLSD